MRRDGRGRAQDLLKYGRGQLRGRRRSGGGRGQLRRVGGHFGGDALGVVRGGGVGCRFAAVASRFRASLASGPDDTS